MNRNDFVLFALLAAIAVVSWLGASKISAAVYELSERTVLVQCECE